MTTTHILRFLALVFVAVDFAPCQTVPPPTYVFHPNQEIRVNHLPSLTAQSAGPTATLVASLEIAINDPEVCCGKNSALEDAVLSADPLSLKQLGSRLQGRYVLGDGRTVAVTTEYLSPDSASPGQIIAPLVKSRPWLMAWNSRLYVVQGVLYNERYYQNGLREFFISKLRLINPLFSDTRRDVSFDRLHDDWTKVQGLLQVTVTQP